MVYDAEAIEEGLREAGMSEERIREIVKEEVTYKVVAKEAKKAAAASEKYAAIVDATAPKCPGPLASPSEGGSPREGQGEFEEQWEPRKIGPDVRGEEFDIPQELLERFDRAKQEMEEVWEELRALMYKQGYGQ